LLLLLKPEGLRSDFRSGRSRLRFGRRGRLRGGLSFGRLLLGWFGHAILVDRVTRPQVGEFAIGFATGLRRCGWGCRCCRCSRCRGGCATTGGTLRREEVVT